MNKTFCLTFVGLLKYQSKLIIIMRSYIMMNQLYHIVSITDNRPKKLSYHLEIRYLDSKNYHIISKAIFWFFKFIISYQNWYSNFKNDYMISKLIFEFHIISNMISESSKLSFHIKNDIDDIYTRKIIISYCIW